MKRLILYLSFLLIFALSCTPSKELVKIPKFTNAWQIQPAGEGPTPSEVTKAMTIFYNEWLVFFGDDRGKVKKALNRLMIEWSGEKKYIDARMFSINGKAIGKPKKRSIGGLTLTKSFVWILIRDDNKISSSSFAHELVHVSLWAIEPNGEGDADHEGPRYKGWTRKHTFFIQHVKYLLKRSNL